MNHRDIAYVAEKETLRTIKFHPAETPENEGLSAMSLYIPKALLKDLDYQDGKRICLTVSVG